MKSEFILCCAIFLTVQRINSTVFDGNLFPLTCPNGMRGIGYSWYANNATRDVYESARFSICVQCQPEERSKYDHIEVCLANTKNILSGIFQFDSIKCDSIFVSHSICNLASPHCGLSLNPKSHTLRDAVWTSETIECENKDSSYTINTNRGYDIELLCPEGSSFSGMERFSLPLKNRFFAPVLSLLCQPTDKHLRNHTILVNAMGIKNDTELIEAFLRNPNCPAKTIKATVTRCVSGIKTDNCGLNLTTSDSTNFSFEVISDCRFNTTKLDQANPWINTLVGCVVGVVILIATSALLLLVFRKLRNNKTSNQRPTMSLQGNTPKNDEVRMKEDLHYEEIEDFNKGLRRQAEKVKFSSIQSKDQPHPSREVPNILKNKKQKDHKNIFFTSSTTMDTVKKERNPPQVITEETNESYNYTIEESPELVVPDDANDVYMKVYQYIK